MRRKPSYCNSKGSHNFHASFALKRLRFFVSLRCTQNDNFKIILFILLFSSLIPYPSSFLRAHTRLFACSIGSDAPGAFMGGSSMGAGLWQSDDTGKTWKQLGWKHVKCYSVDLVNASNGKIIYQACGNGVLRSTDAGANWRMVTDWRITEVMDIAIDQTAPKNIYITTPGAIWKSNDGGDSWFEADSDIPQPIFFTRIRISGNDHNTVLVETDSSIYSTKDGGLSWTKLKTSGDKPSLWNSIPNYPRNIHSNVTFGTMTESFDLLGSLDGGVWKHENISDDEPIRIGLDTEQIWKLKKVEIK